MRAVVRSIECLILFVALAGQGAARAADAPFWLVDSRGVCGWSGAPGDLDYWRLIEGDWQPSTHADFVAADDQALPTVFLVHGNNTDADAAVAQGWQFYRDLQCLGGGRAFRLVVWSWPSERMLRRIRPDLQVKAERSDQEAMRLAGVLAAIDPEVRVTLVGYSYGGRAIAGALHLLAGGGLCGHALPQPLPERIGFRALLVAGAMDAASLAAGCRNGLATTLADRIVVSQNGCDPVLRWYPLLYGRRGPQAIGRTGPAGAALAGERIEVLRVSGEVGKAHDWECYFGSPTLRARIGTLAFYDE